MNIAFVIYNGMTSLDFVGVYDPLTRLQTMGFLPQLSWEICAYSNPVKDSTGLTFVPSVVQASLADYDLLVVPGGITALVANLADNPPFISWLKTAQSCPLKVSVCTGSLLLGAAGFLQGKKATTHPNAFDQLKKFCPDVVDSRVVDTGDVITARGVTSSIDLGLYLCQKFAGLEVKEQIRQRMDYPYGIDIGS